MKRSLLNNFIILIIIALFSVLFFRRSSVEGFAAPGLTFNYSPKFDWGQESYKDNAKPQQGFIGICPMGYKTYILSNKATGATDLKYYACVLRNTASFSKEMSLNKDITADDNSFITVNNQPFDLSQARSCGRAQGYTPTTFRLLATNDRAFQQFTPAKTTTDPASGRQTREPKKNGSSLIGFMCNKT